MTLRDKLNFWINECTREMIGMHNEYSHHLKQIERDAYIRVICELDQPELIMPLSEQHQAAESGPDA